MDLGTELLGNFVQTLQVSGVQTGVLFHQPYYVSATLTEANTELSFVLVSRGEQIDN